MPLATCITNAANDYSSRYAENSPVSTREPIGLCREKGSELLSRGAWRDRPTLVGLR